MFWLAYKVQGCCTTPNQPFFNLNQKQFGGYYLVVFVVIDALKNS